MDTAKVPVFSMINNTAALYPRIVAFKFEAGPAYGGRPDRCHRQHGGTTTWFDVPGDPAENYIQQLEWA